MLVSKVSNEKTSVVTLAQLLEPCPTIADLFTIPGQNIKRVKDETALREAVKDIYLAASIADFDEEPKSKRQKRRAKERRKTEERQRQQTQQHVPNSVGNNTFAVLGDV